MEGLLHRTIGDRGSLVPELLLVLENIDMFLGRFLQVLKAGQDSATLTLN